MKSGPFLTALLLATALVGPAGAAPALQSSASTASPSWSWPLSPRPTVVRPFDPPPEPWLSGHRGVDLQAPADGVPVASPADGVVAFVGVVVDRPVITIDHGGGLRSSFEPVRSSLHQGDPVAKGQEIGVLEPGHCGQLPCVHWGVRRGEEYLDPLAFVMDLRPSVLLPLG
ncbi:M23 family metallopeptidase [Arthrobacter sp. R-11]|uniref:M23 family metallopeptidase n=1 Tax=Arthrobacter sp. R-11 TaxID=3404053 RepID=UPI003CE7763F